MRLISSDPVDMARLAGWGRTPVWRTPDPPGQSRRTREARTTGRWNASGSAESLFHDRPSRMPGQNREMGQSGDLADADKTGEPPATVRMRQTAGTRSSAFDSTLRRKYHSDAVGMTSQRRLLALPDRQSRIPLNAEPFLQPLVAGRPRIRSSRTEERFPVLP